MILKRSSIDINRLLLRKKTRTVHRNGNQGPLPARSTRIDPPEPSARPLTVRRENRTGTTDIKRQNVGPNEKVVVSRSIENGTYRKIACKRKEQEQHKDRNLAPKKQRLVFTDLQRRTLIAIFKENKRPSKEMQLTISQQLGLELSTVSNFFMNARRRCVDRWHEEPSTSPGQPGTSATTFSKA
ncbi:One cut domain family member 3 [Bagarius yarrelli]|uniref:One cut domain family member 3 n=1 Tax=Bagarius yarrelli TaxID=175774 RepID=A0A556UHA2_BAGYA|nr:One cut domain family member 3 [Bagarius yarrelli]